ncbi:MAG: phosphoribosylglycinamide synthetase C domain-containing protein, partial [Thermoleophilaceae bacterium]
ELLEASARPGGLAGVAPEWASEWAVTVVLASRGYPESSSKGDEILGVRPAESLAVEVLHAGTAQVGGKLVTAGGRVLNVTGMGATPAEARERAYATAERVRFDGKQMRHDIALRAVERVEAKA